MGALLAASGLVIVPLPAGPRQQDSFRRTALLTLGRFQNNKPSEGKVRGVAQANESFRVMQAVAAGAAMNSATRE